MRSYILAVAPSPMNIPLDATAELPEEQKQQLLQSIEKTQIRDRYFTDHTFTYYSLHIQHATIQQSGGTLFQSLH